MGLSPRVRGNHVYVVSAPWQHGSIPACAGEPFFCPLQREAIRVYPRVCGGTWSDLAGEQIAEGLSPRVRGNPFTGGGGGSDGGSIPACAGEPWPGASLRYRCRVYPRVCGGTPFRVQSNDNVPGLSPRVRGNPLPRPVKRQCAGSIPACAGEPWSSPPALAKSRVYPRVCGGTLGGIGGEHRELGLSPRVRGNPAKYANAERPHGSIPACAGEPAFHRYVVSISGVYPRVCGGTDPIICPGIRAPGLSPRVRGNLPRRPLPRPCHGSIPACAGEPRFQ